MQDCLLVFLPCFMSWFMSVNLSYCGLWCPQPIGNLPAPQQRCQPRSPPSSTGSQCVAHSYGYGSTQVKYVLRTVPYYSQPGIPAHAQLWSHVQWRLVRVGGLLLAPALLLYSVNTISPFIGSFISNKVTVLLLFISSNCYYSALPWTLLTLTMSLRVPGLSSSKLLT